MVQRADHDASVSELQSPRPRLPPPNQVLPITTTSTYPPITHPSLNVLPITRAVANAETWRSMRGAHACA